jgi:hypothetical protein
VLVLPAEHIREEVFEKFVSAEGEKRAHLFRNYGADVHDRRAHFLHSNHNRAATQGLFGCSACVIRLYRSKKKQKGYDGSALPHFNHSLMVTHLSNVAGCRLLVAGCLLSTVSCPLRVACCLLQVACCGLSFVRGQLSVDLF